MDVIACEDEVKESACVMSCFNFAYVIVSVYQMSGKENRNTYFKCQHHERRHQAVWCTKVMLG